MKTLTQLIAITLLLSFTTSINAQENEGSKKEKCATHLENVYLGASVQVYPAGVIPVLTAEKFLNEKNSILLRGGANIFDRQDFSSENISEEGFGIGGSLGYRRHFPLGNGAFVAGAHIDIWNLWVDWEDRNIFNQRIEGETFTIVVQPWLEGGYYHSFNDGKSRLGASLGFGREINAITDGEDVAQDWIGSILIHYQIKL